MKRILINDSIDEGVMVWCCSWRLSKKESLELDLKKACERLVEGHKDTWGRDSTVDVIVAVCGLIPESVQKNFKFLRKEFRGNVFTIGEKTRFLEGMRKINGQVTLDNVKKTIDAFSSSLSWHKKFSDVQSERRHLFGLSFTGGVMTAACASLSAVSSVYGWEGMEEGMSAMTIFIALAVLLAMFAMFILCKRYLKDFPERETLQTILDCTKKLLVLPRDAVAPAEQECQYLLQVDDSNDDGNDDGVVDLITALNTSFRNRHIPR